jgi:hypothetical protein
MYMPSSPPRLRLCVRKALKTNATGQALVTHLVSGVTSAGNASSQIWNGSLHLPHVYSAYASELKFLNNLYTPDLSSRPTSRDPSFPHLIFSRGCAPPHKISAIAQPECVSTVGLRVCRVKGVPGRSHGMGVLCGVSLQTTRIVRWRAKRHVTYFI